MAFKMKLLPTFMGTC